MTAIYMKAPMFRHTQWVSFVGGEGLVRSYTSESGSWTYLIEMALGPEPNFGRVGAETTIMLNEADLRAVMTLEGGASEFGKSYVKDSHPF